jgi:hypothetical protein
MVYFKTYAITWQIFLLKYIIIACNCICFEIHHFKRISIFLFFILYFYCLIIRMPCNVYIDKSKCNTYLNNSCYYITVVNLFFCQYIHYCLINIKGNSIFFFLLTLNVVCLMLSCIN